MKALLNITLFCFVLLTLCVTSIFGTRYLLDKPKCTEKRMQQIEMKAAKVISMGPYGRPFPENMRQLRYYCKETSKLMNEIENFFRNCYAKNVQDLANIIVYSVKSSIKQFCRRRSRKLIKLLKVTPCINKHIQKQDRCMTRFINSTKQLINVENDKVKIRFACCNYVQTMRCADSFIDSIQCAKNSKELILDFVRGLTGNFVDFICGEYNEVTTRCDELGPQPSPLVPVTKRYVTFIFVLVDLMESMETFHTLI